MMPFRSTSPSSLAARASAGGQWRARNEVKRVLEIFDCATVDTSTLSSLVACGMADLALLLAAPGAGLHLSAADSAACAAAAGHWAAALQTLTADYKGSIYFPKCVSLS